MRVLLRPVLVPELGLVIVKPGRESMPVFHNTRVLVEPEPKSMRNLPSGVVPAVRQPLVEDKTLLPFFSNARVIRAAGGAGAGPAAAGTAHGCPVRAARRNSKKELDSACQMQADLCRTAKNWGCRCNKTGHCTPCGTVQAGL